MKLSDYAAQTGISYRTAWRWFKAGKIKGYQSASGTIIVTESASEPPPQQLAVYARVDSDGTLADLNAQAERLVQYCLARGWRVNQIVKEFGANDDDTRPRLRQLLLQAVVGVIVVESRAHLAGPGLGYIEALLTAQGRRLEVARPDDQPLA